MWLWLSMMPGTTVRPFRSMIRAPDAPGGALLPTATKRPFLVDTIVATVLLRSIVWIRPLMKTSSWLVPPAAPEAACPAPAGPAGPAAGRPAQPKAAATPAAAPAPSSRRRDRRFG